MDVSRADVDECHPFVNLCEYGCTNFPGGYACSCPEGYFLAADGTSCFGKEMLRFVVITAGFAYRLS